MKKYVVFAILSGLGWWFVGCKEQVIDEGIVPLYTPATTDADGGNWRTIVLKSAADITVPPPAATTSSAYQAELSAAKDAFVTPDQSVAITYWAFGGVVRWNQIARQLMAKYNVGPGYDNILGQLATGDTLNPFANSPNAARLFAALTVAQYDALVVAWRAKYQYNRPSLAKQGLAARVPVLDIPSYPSEDAAVAEASFRVLSFFFPAETEWLKAKATEHKQSRMQAGISLPSDVKAGEDLAATVATRVIGRVQTDRLGAGNTSSWEAMRASASYDVKWKSLELPARSPVLPLAGNLKTWFDSTAVFAAAPGAPLQTTSPDFQKALAEVRAIANTRTREQYRIAAYWADGIGTYTLPGHWNFIAEGIIQQALQNELRAARTYALMNRAMQDGAAVNWRTKYRYFVPRPSQLDPTIKTATGIPNYPAYPSEYATFSSAAAAVLNYLFPNQANSLNAQANEAIQSQLYGGIHYRFDNEAGAAIGAGVGKIAVDWAKADGAK